jgi:glycosyltransferase involved in cell wall biosynthesis
MRIGIDASNIRTGGGVTHLKELLTAAQPNALGIEKVTVWGSLNTLAQLPDRIWLLKTADDCLEGNIFQRVYWQRYRLPFLAKAECDLLFLPGGNNLGHLGLVVAMSQNILPFDTHERARYGISSTRLRLFLLKWTQAVTFREAAGVIFLTRTAQKIVEAKIGSFSKVAVIPHGISDNFRKEPRSQLALDAFSVTRPFRWLYVSIIDVYKHQANVAEAMVALRREGIPVVVDLIGPAYPSALRSLKRTLQKIDPKGEVVRYLGPVSYDKLARYYQETDAFVFASSCENMPIILLEAMAAGLPIACSNRDPMSEVLKDAGIYFDPESPQQIAQAMRELILSPERRKVCAEKAYEYATKYSWKRCAHETFDFITKVAGRSK